MNRFHALLLVLVLVSTGGTGWGAASPSPDTTLEARRAAWKFKIEKIRARREEHTRVRDSLMGAQTQPTQNPVDTIHKKRK